MPRCEPPADPDRRWRRRVRVYLLVMLVAAAVTYLATPFARWLASGPAPSPPCARATCTPSRPRGWAASRCSLGLAVALLFASQMPFLEGVFEDNASAWGILGAARRSCACSAVADDIWDLDWMTKLAGQVLAAGFMAWQGVQLITLPIGGLTDRVGRACRCSSPCSPSSSR